MSSRKRVQPLIPLVTLILTLGISLPVWSQKISQDASQQTNLVAYSGNNGLGSSYPASVSGYMSWLKQQFSDNNIPGAAVAIVSRDAVLDVQTWGVLNKRDNTPVTSESLFRIASVSKTFAGTVAAMLVDRNLQTWDTPILQTLPDIQIGTGQTSKDINLRDLVSHTTGLMPHAYSNMLDDGVAYEKIREKFREIPTVCPPGRCYGYQNVIFTLIADVVETSTDSRYDDYLQEHLFNPLGMTTASTGLDKLEASPYATSPHRLVRSEWRTTTHNPAYYSVSPAAGINASILDMAIWTRANLGGYPEVLSPAFLQVQHNPVVETPRGNYFNRWQGLEGAYYALGWRVFDYKGLHVIHHGGGVRGYRSEMAMVPQKDIGIVVLFNAETTLANDIVPGFLDSLVSE